MGHQFPSFTKPTFQEMTRPTFQELFADWVDADVAMLYLAIALGMTDLDESGWGYVVGVFYTNNAVSKSLYNLIEQFTEQGLLEMNELQQYRWNKDYEKHEDFERLWARNQRDLE